MRNGGAVIRFKRNRILHLNISYREKKNVKNSNDTLTMMLDKSRESEKNRGETCVCLIVNVNKARRAPRAYGLRDVF